MASFSGKIVAAVEGGGTSFVVAVAQVPSSSTNTNYLEPTCILHRAEIDSSHDRPQQTLDECAAFFEKHKPQDGYDALGIAMFGPVGLKKSTKQYGCILGSSPKAPWRNINFLKPLEKACRSDVKPLSIFIDTDVNAPALAEFLVAKKRSRNITSLAYITVGTGIGVGLVVNNKTVHGLMHPEGGHVAVQPLPNDPFPGYSWGDKSPYQGKHTVEGMASSVALTERLELMTQLKQDSRSCLANLQDDHELWNHASNALANLCVTLMLTMSIEKIVLGGGIMQRKALIEKIRSRMVILLNGYLELPPNMSDYITLSTYASNVGLMGAIVLAQEGMKVEDAANNNDDDQRLNNAKRTAYGVGVQHGVILGISAVVIAWGFLSRRSKK